MGTTPDTDPVGVAPRPDLAPVEARRRAAAAIALLAGVLAVCVYVLPWFTVATPATAHTTPDGATVSVTPASSADLTAPEAITVAKRALAAPLDARSKALPWIPAEKFGLPMAAISAALVAAMTLVALVWRKALIAGFAALTASQLFGQAGTFAADAMRAAGGTGGATVTLRWPATVYAYGVDALCVAAAGIFVWLAVAWWRTRADRKAAGTHTPLSERLVSGTGVAGMLVTLISESAAKAAAPTAEEAAKH